jgi:hypothetical protein
LSSEQIAEFVTLGFLRFDALVPEEINAVALEELKNKPSDRIVSPFDTELPGAGSRLSEHFQNLPGIGAYLCLPTPRAWDRRSGGRSRTLSRRT